MSAEVVNTDSSSATFFAVSAGNYAQADLAFWRAMTVIGDNVPTVQEARHLDTLRARRRETYFDLVSWAMRCEAERLGGGS